MRVAREEPRAQTPASIPYEGLVWEVSRPYAPDQRLLLAASYPVPTDEPYDLPPTPRAAFERSPESLRGDNAAAHSHPRGP